MPIIRPSLFTFYLHTFYWVTVVAIALFVALIVTMRKLDSKKNTSLPGR